MSMVIIEDDETAIRIINDIREMIVIPILSDVKLHPQLNSISVLAVMGDGKTYVFPVDHPQGKKMNTDKILSVLNGKQMFVPDKKNMMYYLTHHETIYDLSSVEYLMSGSVTGPEKFYTPHHTKMYDLLWTESHVNKSIALVKHVEFLSYYSQFLVSLIQGVNDNKDNFWNDQGNLDYHFFHSTAIPALQFIERSGLYVDIEEAKKHFSEKGIGLSRDNMLWSQYNLYTSTGRASNKFGGINFAALNKSDETRKSFISRFGNDGILVNADFESFHLRLIADMIGYTFPTHIPVHDYLGRQYFNKDELTDEEYEQSKKITFHNLYGEDRKSNVPEFFTKVYEYVDVLMVLLNTNGYILSPYYKRKIFKERIENPTPQKIFSYVIQLAETELNLQSISKAIPLFNGKQTKPILYTYDSILFDVCLDDGKEFLDGVIKVLSHDGKFPMRVAFGKNYHELKRVVI